MINRLNCKSELYGTVIKDDGYEISKTTGKIKDIYCEIIPSGGGSSWTKDVKEEIEHTHRFRVRIKSITDPKSDMYFIYRNQRYEFTYWNVDFKNKEFLEVFTKLKIE